MNSSINLLNDQFLVGPRGSTLRAERLEREKRKAIQLAEAESIVELFLENRMKPGFMEEYNLTMYQLRSGVIPERYLLYNLNRLVIFRDDPLGHQQAAHRAVVGLVKGNILAIVSSGINWKEEEDDEYEWEGREFRIVDAACFYEPHPGESIDQMAVEFLGGWQ